jgi:hypothetical protein
VTTRINPRGPTDAPAGSPARQTVYAARAVAGLGLFDERDSRALIDPRETAALARALRKSKAAVLHLLDGKRRRRKALAAVSKEWVRRLRKEIEAEVAR